MRKLKTRGNHWIFGVKKKIYMIIDVYIGLRVVDKFNLKQSIFLEPWSGVDLNGTPRMNFKSVTREVKCSLDRKANACKTSS